METERAQQALLLNELLKQSILAVAMVTKDGQILFKSQGFDAIFGNHRQPKPDGPIETLISELLICDENKLRACLNAEENSQTLCQHKYDQTPYLLTISHAVKECKLISFQPASTTKLPSRPEEADTLTGLGNRARFERLIQNPISLQNGDQAAMMIIDLDEFKRINDTLGHPVGDKLLKLVAKRFKKIFRKDDQLIRLGGDEFLAIFQDQNTLDSLIKLGERIVNAAGKSFIINGHQIDIGASVGIALAQPECTKWDQVYRQADLALYHTKRNGKGSVSFYSAEIEEQTLMQRAIEIGLKRALLKQEMFLTYQPQIDVKSQAITGFEALLRWDSGELGLVEPDRFIAVAEDIGEIQNIGRWVLETACAEAKNWPDHLMVCVNVSPKQLMAGSFIHDIERILDKENLHPSRLELEISEEVLFEPGADAVVEKLFSLGVRVALDDTGTGCNSLRQLKNIRFSRLKVDRSFVHVEGQESPSDMVKTVLEIGKVLGVPVVVEGVETTAEFQSLKDDGCSAMQGYLFSRPLTKDAIPTFLETIDKHAGGINE